MKDLDRGITRDYILMYAVSAFLSLALWARAWGIVQVKDEPLGKFLGITVPGPNNLLLQDNVYLVLILGFMVLSIFLTLSSQISKFHGFGLGLIKAFSFPFGVLTLAGFTIGWIDAFSRLHRIDSAPTVVVQIVFWVGLVFFIGLSSLVAFSPWLKRRSEWPWFKSAALISALGNIISSVTMNSLGLLKAATRTAVQGLTANWWLFPLIFVLALIALIADGRLKLAEFAALLAATVAAAGLLFHIISSRRQEIHLTSMASRLSMEPSIDVRFADDSNEVILAADWSEPIKVVPKPHPILGSRWLGEPPEPLPPGCAPVMFLVRNTGTMEAENVNILLALPVGCNLAVRKGGTAGLFLSPRISDMPTWNASRANRSQIQITGDNLGPGLHRVIRPSLDVQFPEAASSYNLTYQAYCGNRATPSSGEVTIHLANADAEPTKRFPGDVFPWESEEEEE